MKNLRTIGLLAVIMSFLTVAALAQREEGGPTQAELASKTAKFGTVAATDDSYKNAIGARDLKIAASKVGSEGAFKGTVVKLYTPKSGALVILNFDRDYKSALTAVVKRSYFAKFPDLNGLEGKKVLITGKFVDFHGATEIDLSDPSQIKIVE